MATQWRRIYEAKFTMSRALHAHKVSPAKVSPALVKQDHCTRERRTQALNELNFGAYGRKTLIGIAHGVRAGRPGPACRFAPGRLQREVEHDPAFDIAKTHALEHLVDIVEAVRGDGGLDLSLFGEDQ